MVHSNPEVIVVAMRLGSLGVGRAIFALEPSTHPLFYAQLSALRKHDMARVREVAFIALSAMTASSVARAWCVVDANFIVSAKCATRMQAESDMFPSIFAAFEDPSHKVAEVLCAALACDLASSLPGGRRTAGAARAVHGRRPQARVPTGTPV